MAARPPIPALTGLRFVAALSVALSHSVTQLVPWVGVPPTWYTLIASAAGFGMPLFFVLSGFVIHYNYCEDVNDGAVGIYNFFVARFSRLYPLYFVGLIYDTINNYTLFKPQTDIFSVFPYYLTMTQSWFYRLYTEHSLIFVLGLVPQVSWSVSTEWFFYVVYPLVGYAILHNIKSLRSKIISICILMLAGFGMMSIAISQMGSIEDLAVSSFGRMSAGAPYGLDSFFKWLVYFSPYSRVFEFVTGVLISSIYFHTNNVDKKRGIIMTISSICLIFSTLYVLFGTYMIGSPLLREISYLQLSFGFAPSVAILIFCCASYENSITRLLSSKWLVLCGNASYSLYLLHLVVIQEWASRAPQAVDLRVGSGDVMRMCLCLSACIGLSLISWRMIEVPSQRAMRRLLSRGRPASARGLLRSPH